MICMYVCIYDMYLGMYVFMNDMYAYACMDGCMYMYVCICECMCVCM